jgi:hypothetical protein
MALQAAEKGPVWRKCPYELLQGLKPNVDLMGFIGTTKVMPRYKAFETGNLKRVFPHPV